MKKITLFFAAILVAGIAGAQKIKESDVPAAVRAAFASAFPKASAVKWSKESADELEAEFKSGKTEMSANFSMAGVWKGTETEIKKAELPKAVQETIAKEFAGYKIEEAEKAETPDHVMKYEVELEKGEVTLEVVFSQDGKVISKEEKKEKEKD